jgi:hypothetical protein
MLWLTRTRLKQCLTLEVPAHSGVRRLLDGQSERCHTAETAKALLQSAAASQPSSPGLQPYIHNAISPSVHQTLNKCCRVLTLCILPVFAML